MKQFLSIDAHSFVDVITNSSTELFVCDTDKTVEAVKEILDANPDVNGYDPPWVFSVKEYREYKKKESYVIDDNSGKPYGCIDGWFYDEENEEDLDYLRKNYIENGNQSGGYWNSRHEFAKRIQEATRPDGNFEHLRIHDYKAQRMEVEKILEEYRAMENKPDWWIHPLKYHYNSQSITELDGKIILIGSGDNSIDFDSFDWIIETFNARSHHLG